MEHCIMATCPQCTLINPGTNQTCQACGLSLNHDDASADSYQSGIDELRLRAYQQMPEAFVPIQMLHLRGWISNHPVTMLVDTGAQMSMMMLSQAKALGMARYIDHEWSGRAVGVGTRRIIGKLFCVEVRLETAFIECCFTILEDSTDGAPLNIILGLDMMSNLGATIDLKKRAMVFGDQTIHFVQNLRNHP